MTRPIGIYGAIAARGLVDGAEPFDAQKKALEGAKALKAEPSTAEFLHTEQLLSLPARVRMQKANELLDQLAQKDGLSRADFLRRLEERLSAALDRAEPIPIGRPIDEPERPNPISIDDLVADDLRSGDPQAVLRIQRALVEIDPMTDGELRTFHSRLTSNSAEHFPKPVQRALWRFLELPDRELRKKAVELASSGPIDLEGARALASQADQGGFTAAKKQTLLGIAATLPIQDAAKRLLEEKAATLSFAESLERAKQGPIDAAAWSTHLAPELAATPFQWSPIADAFLQLRFDPKVEMEVSVRAALDEMLRNRGYPLPTLNNGPIIGPPSAIRDRSVTAPDRVFERLSRATGQQGEILIGVLDGGFEIDHPVVKPRLWSEPGAADVHGINLIMPNEDLSTTGQLSVHGNHVVSIATRGTDRIKAVLAATSMNDVAKAIEYAVSKGARVINFSQRVDGPFVAPVLKAIEAHPEVLFIEAAGNDERRIGEGTTLYDHDRDNFIKVAAADEHGAKLPRSNFGPSATLATEAKFSSTSDRIDQAQTTGQDLYYYSGQTSQAAPNAANVATKMKLLAPELTPNEIKRLLILTSDRSPEWEGLVEAGGRINAERALSAAAAIGLTRRGATLDEAIAQLELEPRLAGEVRAVGSFP